jgi:hypothetical protein
MACFELVVRAGDALFYPSRELEFSTNFLAIGLYIAARGRSRGL